MAISKDIDIVGYVKECVDPEILLKALGFKITRRTYKELRAPCIIHGGDNPTAFRFRLESKTFICFTKRCQTEGSRTENDIIGLVRKVKRCSFVQAVEYLADLFAVDLEDDWKKTKLVDEETIKSFYREKQIEDLVKETEKIKQKRVEYIPEKVVQRYKKARGDYFTRMGVPEDVQNFFDIGYYIDDFGNTRASIPIRDLTGGVVSISGRRVDSDKEPRYKLTQDFDKSGVVYNLNNAVNYSDVFNGTVVVVEGFKAAWAVFMAGFPNVIACIGAYLLEPQARLLSKSGFTSCLLFLDGDEAGGRATESSLLLAHKYMKTKSVNLYKNFPGMSPDDFDSEMLFMIIDKYLKEF